MSQGSQQHGRLAQLLDVSPINERVFIGQSEHLGFRSLFGGQVLGQAVVAAAKTVAKDRLIHSLHAYFLRPGDQAEPVQYEVEHTRTGASFATRRVTAKQGANVIFTMMASFQKREESYEHSPSMPQVVGPDELSSDKEHLRKIAHLLPAEERDRLLADYSIEIRTIEHRDYVNPGKHPPFLHSWMHLREDFPDEPILQQGALAYASDFGIATVALRPHGATLLTPGLHVASIDHAMWFHQLQPWQGWRLYVRDSPFAGGARGLNRGQIYAADGTLLASVTQESLIRQRS